MDNITAVLSVFEYSTDKVITYNPVREIYSDNKGYINISILVSIITQDFRERKLTANILHPEIIEDGTKVRIYPAVLKEFSINTKDNKNTVAITNLIPEFTSHRSDVKFNLKNIKTFGKGNYVVVLNELTEAEVEENPRAIIEKAIANYSFEVK